MGIKGMMGLGLRIPRDSGKAVSIVVGAGEGIFQGNKRALGLPADAW